MAHRSTILLTLLLSSLINVGFAGVGRNGGRKLAGENPFTAKAALSRYWKNQITNNLPKPKFLLDKASPLNAVDLATFSSLAETKSLSSRLHDFCAKADLLCADGLSTSLVKHNKDVNFTTYAAQNFTSYGSKRPGGADSFKNYSNGRTDPAPGNGFTRYSRGSNAHDDSFTTYADEAVNAPQSFSSYAKSAASGAGKFENYQEGAIIANLEFTSYSDDTAAGRKQGFTSYASGAYQGKQEFTSYDKNSVDPQSEFTTYSGRSRGFESGFSHYGETGTRSEEKFSQYGPGNNIGNNHFISYTDHGNGNVDFKHYSEGTYLRTDEFTSYAKNASSSASNFENYGDQFTNGPVKFTSYGEDADSSTTTKFSTYTRDVDFKKYSKDRATFDNYANQTHLLRQTGTETDSVSTGEKVIKNNQWVETGKFFRERMLKPGTLMPMPDIRDKMPKRSFLPRGIASKLPLTQTGFGAIKEVFHAGDDSSRMSQMIRDALNECGRAPSPGETKRCVGSGEDMIDFAMSVLGRNIAVRTMENTRGYGGNVLIGSVRGINGGKITESVSCHQSLFPWLMYYCHSVPKVRVYEADIVDPTSKEKINHGVAICHVDTTSWSSGHGAFLALGSGPGKIEVCHWIFEGDMTWAVADGPN